jgi:undecaprenyl-diphosphatase
MPIWLLAVILGIVEGITEFIPVSSTGHLLISEHLLKIHGTNGPESFLHSDLFNIVIQAGAVMAVIPLFWDRIALMLRFREPAGQTLLKKIVVACLITAGPGFIIEKKFKLPEELKPVALALLIGGIVFIVVETVLRKKALRDEALNYGKTRHEDLAWAAVIAIGIGQLIAGIFPGASRSGTTIMLAMIVGASRPGATEFSFLVGIPTMLGVSALKLFKALHHPAEDAAPPDWAMLWLAFFVAAVVSFVAVKWLLRYVQTHSFIGFGIYRIIVGVILLACLHFGLQILR